MSTKPKIALFLGSDIVAHMIMSRVVPFMIENGIEPVLYYPKHKPIKNPDAHQAELLSLAYAERHILREVVFPFLDARPCPQARFQTPNQIAAQYKLKLEEVDDINDPAFLDSLKTMPGLIGGTSIRCFQKFGTPIVTFFRSRGFLTNWHPGMAPEFRGVLSTMREMASGKGLFGSVLHHVDPYTPSKGNKFAGIDTGRILQLLCDRIGDPSRTLYSLNISKADQGVDLIEQMIRDLKKSRVLHGQPQPGGGTYYTWPNAAELQSARDNLGIRLFDKDEVVDILCRAFSDGGCHGTDFENAVRTALNSKTPMHMAVSNSNLPPARRRPAGTAGKVPTSATSGKITGTSPPRVVL